MTSRTLSPRYISLTVTTPAATPQASPQSTPVVVGHVILVSVSILIPPGHVGVTGVQVDLAQEPILPWGRPQGFIVGDNFRDTYNIDIEVDTGLTVVTFNTGNYSHQHFLEFHVIDIAQGGPPPTPVLVDLSAYAAVAAAR